MPNATMDESQAGIKAVGRNINNLRYADDTTLMAESNEELKSLLMRVKGEWKACLKSTFKKLWQKKGEEVGRVTDFISLGSKITVNSE